MSMKWRYPFDESQERQDLLAEIVSNAISRIEILEGKDVDALFRLICSHEVTWGKNKKIIISNKNVW